MPVKRTQAEILGLFMDRVKNDIRKVLPATVTAVHTDRQTVDVQVAVQNILFDELGTAVAEPAPSLADVPLGVMRGGGFLVWVPVAVGDSVLLVFSDLSCDTWRAGDGSPQPPGWTGKHSHDSPFALPCVAPDAKFLSSPSASDLVIGKDGADEQIIISGSEIDLGRGAISFVALATKVDAIFTALKTFLTAFTTYIGGIQPIADPSSSFTPAMVTATGTLAAAVVPTGASLVKAK